MCARRRSNFLLSRQEKVTKEKATLLCVSLRCATGNLRCSGRGCAAELTARLQRSVQTTAASQCTKCVCPAAHARTPCPALLGTRRRDPAAGHPFGPLLRSAAPARREALAHGRSGRAKQRPVWLFGCLDVRLSTPCWLRLRRGSCGVSMGARAPMPRHLTRRGCPSGARQRKASSTAHPATAPTQVCPVATRRGRRLWVAFLLGTFLWRSKEEVPRPPGRDPAYDLRKLKRYELDSCMRRYHLRQSLISFKTHPLTPPHHGMELAIPSTTL